MKKIIALIFCMLMIPLSVIAQENQEETQLVEQAAGITPDNPLYQLDILFDDIQAALASGEKKAEIRLQISEERLAEYSVMVKENNMVKAQQAISEHGKQLRKLDQEQAKLTEQERERTQARIYKHLAVLEGVRAKAPEQAKQGLDNAIANAGKSLDNVRESLPAEKRKTNQQLKTETQTQFENQILGQTSSTETRETKREQAIEEVQKSDQSGESIGNRMYAVYGFE